MKQTAEFKKAIKLFKKVTKFSALLDKSSTYEFNGVRDADLTEVDIKRIKKAIERVKIRTQELENVFDEQLKQMK
jgi:hypothetical protein